MTPAARIAAAIDLLRAVEGAPTRPADAVASDYFRTRRFIGAGDRRAVSERAWGVLRARRRLEWWLARSGAPPTPRLLVGAALLCEGWSAQGLGQAFSGGRFAAERLDAEEQAALGDLVGRTLEHPSMPAAVRLELPDWILPKLEARFGRSLGDELTAMLEPASLDMRANLLKGTREDARAALAAEGYEAEPTRFSPWGLRLPGRRPVTAGKAFQSGLVEIQDEGSQLVALLTRAKPGMRVLDLCAGAGGKTLALAAMMENRGHIAACDVSTPRLDAAVKRFRRAGVHNVECHKIDAGDRWLKRRVGGFDRVLVDAPCTGTGTWRRNPDARTRLTETDLAELVVRQAALLDDAAPLVRKGGWLVYATCSLLPEENEEQVNAFIARHAGFTVVPLARAWSLDAPPPCGGEMLVLTPRQHGTDGFFCAVLERTA